MTPTPTESAVAAIFDDSSKAQAAAAELITNAFAGDHIHIATEAQPGSSEQEVVQSTGAHPEPDVQHWVESVFGEESETERRRYEKAVRQGKALLGVNAPDQMAGQVADIVNHHAPVETILARNSPR